MSGNCTIHEGREQCAGSHYSSLLWFVLQCTWIEPWLLPWYWSEYNLVTVDQGSPRSLLNSPNSSSSSGNHGFPFLESLWRVEWLFRSLGLALWFCVRRCVHSAFSFSTAHAFDEVLGARLLHNGQSGADRGWTRDGGWLTAPGRNVRKYACRWPCGWMRMMPRPKISCVPPGLVRRSTPDGASSVVMVPTEWQLA